MLAILLTLLSTTSPADTVAQLDNVEVTASTARTVRNAAPVQMADRAALERLGDAGVSDALKHFSGVTVNDYGGLGGLKTVSVRAMGAKHTAVAYDGVPVTDAQSGDIDISRFRLDNVETLTLSTSGSDAIFRPARMFGTGASLAITSRRPLKTAGHPLSASASVSAGSWGYVAPSLRADWRIDSAGDYTLSASAAWLRADGAYPFRVENGLEPVTGRRHNSDVESITGEINMNLANVSIKGYFYDSDRGLPGAVVFYNSYAAERLHDRNAFTQAVWRFSPAPGLTLRAIGKFNYSQSRYSDRRPSYPGGVRREDHTQREAYLSVGALWKPGREWAVSLTSDLAGNHMRAKAPDAAQPERLTCQTVAAAAFTSERWHVSAAMLATDIHERVRRGACAGPLHRFSPSVSASWRVIPGRDLHLRASVADGFRVPTFADRYYTRIGNAALRPERAIQSNLGITWACAAPTIGLSSLTLTADGYFNRVKDKIVAVPTLYVWVMRNVGVADIGGIDATACAQFALPHEISLTANCSFSWQHAVDVTPGAATRGHVLPYTAAMSGSASLSAEWRGFSLTYAVTAMGKRFAAYLSGPDNRIAPYADQSLSAGCTFPLRRCRLSIRAEALNLAGENYQVIRYYPMPGRQFRISTSITI